MSEAIEAALDFFAFPVYRKTLAQHELEQTKRLVIRTSPVDHTQPQCPHTLHQQSICPLHHHNNNYAPTALV